MDFEALSVFRLDRSVHESPEEGLCAMEAVAWLEGLPHNDHPKCSCPIISAFVRRLNDGMPDVDRQRLVAYLPRLVGTFSPRHEPERAKYLAQEVSYRFAFCYDPLRQRAGRGALACLRDGKYAEAALLSAVTACFAFNAGYRGAWNHALEMLDGVLKIGPSGTFTTNIPERVNAYRREILKEAV